MSAKLDVKGLTILSKEIAATSCQHALVLQDIGKVSWEIARLETAMRDGKVTSLTGYNLRVYKAALSDLLARERQILEHREALLAQLRS